MYIKSISDFRKAVRIKFAWPGGYPTFFICSDGASLCHDCIKSERSTILRAVAERMNNGWRVVALDVNWEDATLLCDHCNEHIPSAYGDEP